ncbi:MAG: GNAT family N-acetyltransferase [Acidobacteriota bacterium]
MSDDDRAIRRAKPEEAEQLSELAFRSKGYWGYSPEFMEACREELTLSPAYVRTASTYAALMAERIVGFYALARMSDDEVELGFLFVEPEAIGQGFGRQLIEHAKSEARDSGYATMVIPGDPNAARFYEAAGGRLVGETPSGSIPGRMLPLLHIDL